MPTARSLVAALTLALTAISCSDKGPTEANNVGENQTPVIAQAAGQLILATNQTFTSALGSATVTSVRITRLTRTATGDLLASGTVSGTFTNVLNQTSNFTRAFTDIPIEITQQGRRCRILHLDLGPLFLDLLGLEIDLSRITLDITAVSGPGNLLGNLLCALVGLLDGPNLTALDRVLAQINAILGG